MVLFIIRSDVTRKRAQSWAELLTHVLSRFASVSRLTRPRVQTTPEEFENAALFLQLSLPSTLIRYENGALFLQLGLPSTLIRYENAALFLQLGLPSTLIRYENGALFLQLGLPSTLIRYENAALFLQLSLPSTLIRYENGAFRKRSSNWRNLNMPASRFRVDGKHWKTELFKNDDVMIIRFNEQNTGCAREF